MAPPAVETVTAPCRISVPAFRVSDELVLLCTAAEIVIDPEVSMVTLPVERAVTRSELRMFTAPEELASKIPFVNVPPVVTPLLMVIDEGIKVGVMLWVAPTNASDVNVKVWAVEIPLWNPSPVKVATPLTVVTEVEVIDVPLS